MSAIGSLGPQRRWADVRQEELPPGTPIEVIAAELGIDLTTPMTEDEYEAWFNATEFLHEEYRQ